MVRTDEHRLAQVLLCLQSNAMKFTFHGGIDIKVKITEDKKYIFVEVKDTGIGIKNEDQEKLF